MYFNAQFLFYFSFHLSIPDFSVGILMLSIVGGKAAAISHCPTPDRTLNHFQCTVLALRETTYITVVSRNIQLRAH